MPQTPFLVYLSANLENKANENPSVSYSYSYHIK